jgi:hypothetical protein
MAKGQESKTKIFDALREKFPKSFWEDEGKILRIPFNEGGERVEVKVQCTAAKVNLREDDESNIANFGSESKGKIEFKVDVEPSAEEISNIKNMLKALDL